MRNSESLDEAYEPQGVWKSNANAWRVCGRLIGTQTAIGLTLSALWLIYSTTAAAASIAGMLIAIIPTLYYAIKVFSNRPGTAPRKVVRAFYVGEIVRLILAATLFIIALQWFGGEFVPLITTFTAALFSYWLILLGALRT
ncbi:hypothetical protein CKO08_01100 [Halorhodospira halochloris]|nr:hypothetical protein [Halorhodospira halochloris]